LNVIFILAAVSGLKMKLGGVVMARWGDGTQLLAGKLDQYGSKRLWK
tara:strand:+ start:2679 stop:2819 length:141 start_codon:yes stop_codon:yes gene_type:complete